MSVAYLPPTGCPPGGLPTIQPRERDGGVDGPCQRQVGSSPSALPPSVDTGTARRSRWREGTLKTRELIHRQSKALEELKGELRELQAMLASCSLSGLIRECLGSRALYASSRPGKLKS